MIVDGFLLDLYCDTSNPISNHTSTDAATPGSTAAVAIGCKCPVSDNSYGRGAYGGAALDADGKPLFWVNDDCPLHGRGKGTIDERN